MALGLCQHKLSIAIYFCSMAERRQAIFIGTVLKEKITCILVYLLIFRCQSNISLQIEKSFIRIALNLQAFSSLEVRFGIFLV